MNGKKNGKIIVIEGLDGCGKSTQWELLRTGLTSAKFEFVTFPDYDSRAGRLISDYLSGEFGEFGDNPYAVSSFYAVDRFVSFAKGSWGKAYHSGRTVICARYTSSNAIYQMAKLPQTQREAYLQWLYGFEHEHLRIPRPDLTVFLNVPLAVSQKLLQNRETAADIHESDMVYREKCRQCAEYLAQREGWTQINCAGSDGEMRTVENIHDELIRIITDATI
jgi:dTMP kinase